MGSSRSRNRFSFGFQTRLLCSSNKACLHSKQGFFSLQTSLVFKVGAAVFLCIGVMLWHIVRCGWCATVFPPYAATVVCAISRQRLADFGNKCYFCIRIRIGAEKTTSIFIFKHYDTVNDGLRQVGRNVQGKENQCRDKVAQQQDARPFHTHRTSLS